MSSSDPSRISTKNKKAQLTQAQKLKFNVRLLNFLDNTNSFVSKILISVIILFLFIFINYIANTLGSKTRTLLSNKYWYNKQIIIFLTIYLAINITSLHGLKIRPIFTLISSIIGWFLFNVVTSLGEVWISKNPPMTWFTIVIIPMILFYIVNDFKNYYKQSEPNATNTRLVNIFKIFQIILLLLILILLIIGFYFSYSKAKKKLKSNFDFKKFFFAIKS